MDPEACLKKIRSIVDEVLNDDNEDDDDLDTAATLLELCERIQALDGWIMKGGFLPEEWAAARRRSDALQRAADAVKVKRPATRPCNLNPPCTCKQEEQPDNPQRTGMFQDKKE